MPAASSNRAAVLAALPLAAASLKLRRERPSAAWVPLAHQIPPEGSWHTWMIRGGRGSGKTRPMVQYVLAHLEQLGSKARVGIGAPTIADARDVCAEGESGLITVAGGRFRSYNRSMGEAWHAAGGYVKFLGSEEPDRWNGPQWTLLWADELALWKRDPKDKTGKLPPPAWDQAQFGLRLGDHPRSLVSTTPKARHFLREMEKQAGVVVTRAHMRDNPHLSPIARQRLLDRYEGTRTGRQELGGEYLDDVPGALWTSERLEEHRVPSHPDLVRIVVAVDPSGGHGDGNDEQGIVVAGKGVDGRGYVLADRSCKLTPDGWGRRAVQAYLDFSADRIVYEQNFGGEMVEAVIRTAAQAMGVTVATKAVHASRGKAVRAEPIAALDEQGRLSIVGSLAELEDELCSWTPESGYSPNRLDALVWTLTELMLGGSEVQFY